MKSKAELIQEHLCNLAVFDIGGAGYGDDNSYERQLAAAWATVKTRYVVDRSDRANLQVNLNALPLPVIQGGPWDIATLFDVLEHLEHPVDVLRWVPTPRIMVSLPNGLSPIARRMEVKGQMQHLYSFTPYTATMLLKQAGWSVEQMYTTMGKWSTVARAINLVGSLAAPWVGTGMMLLARR